MPPPATTQATIDGVRCTLEKLGDGTIRVTHDSQQVNPSTGRGTAGEFMYIVHPAQKNQYDFINAMLPEKEQATLSAGEARPWWSYTGADKEKREKAGGGE